MGHHISDRVSIGVSRFGNYFDGQITISNDANYFHRTFVADYRYRTNVFASHHPRGMANQIAR
jgi:hypothetical protein